MKLPPINPENPEETIEEFEKRKEELMNEMGKSKRSCCFGCLIPLLIVLVLFLASMIYVSHLPAFKPLITCVENQIELNDAIRRYKDLNNKYPEKLSDLEKEYLKDKSILYCPLDKEKNGYEYNNPEKDKSCKSITRCDRHSLTPEQKIPPIMITPESKFAYDMEAFEKEIKK